MCVCVHIYLADFVTRSLSGLFNMDVGRCVLSAWVLIGFVVFIQTGEFIVIATCKLISR